MFQVGILCLWSSVELILFLFSQARLVSGLGGWGNKEREKKDKARRRFVQPRNSCSKYSLARNWLSIELPLFEIQRMWLEWEKRKMVQGKWLIISILFLAIHSKLRDFIVKVCGIECINTPTLSTGSFWNNLCWPLPLVNNSTEMHLSNGRRDREFVIEGGMGWPTPRINTNERDY